MMNEECLLKFNSIPFMKARHLIHTGYNGVIVLSGNKREQGYVLAHKLTEGIDERVLYYKPDEMALKYIFGKNFEEFSRINDLGQVGDGVIIIADSKTLGRLSKLNKLPHYIFITKSQKIKPEKKTVVFRILTSEKFLNNIEVWDGKERVEIIQ